MSQSNIEVLKTFIVNSIMRNKINVKPLKLLPIGATVPKTHHKNPIQPL